MSIAAKSMSRLIVTPIICKVSHSIVSGLAALADYALLTRQDKGLLDSINLLRSQFPDNPTTILYSASRRCIALEDARPSLESILSDGHVKLKMRAALILGGKCLDSGFYDESERLHAIGLRLTEKNSIAQLEFLKNIAVLSSIDGDHKSAFRILKTILEPAYRLSSLNPVLWLDCLNSLAEELRQLGQLRQAFEFMSLPLRSGYLSRYPQWMDTAKDITSQIKEQKIWTPSFKKQESELEDITDNLVTLIPKERADRVKGPARVLRFKCRTAYQMSLEAGVVSQLLTQASGPTIGSIFTFLYDEGVELQDERPRVAIIRAILRGQVKPATLLKITIMLNLDYNTAS